MTIEERNLMLRRAVETRREAQAAGKPSEEWYGNEFTQFEMDAARTESLPERNTAEDLSQNASCCEGQRLRGDSLLNERPGTTAKFGTGAVRSDTFEEFRYDLISPIGLREIARACAEGADKYGDWNWEKGMPVHDLLNHAIAHIYGFLSGDRSEPHLGHAAWNLLAAIHSYELWPHLNDGNLRSGLCRAPQGLNACEPPAQGV